MAKGDSGTAGQMQAPKMDQYSVMHGIMDRLGGSMAPSQMPNFGAQPNFGGGGRMGGPMGGVRPMGQGNWQAMSQQQMPQQMPSVSPGPDVVTPDFLRRIMMGNNVG